MIAELLSENAIVWTCLWQSTACVAAGLIGSFILRHRPARAHQVLLLAMIAALALPAMSIMVKHFDLGLLSAEPAVVLSAKEIALPETTYAAVETIADDIIEYEPPAVEPAESGPAATVAAEKTDIPWGRMLPWAWIAASLALAARLGVAFVRGKRLLRRATPLSCEEILKAVRMAKAKLGIAEEVSVLGSRDIRSPVIWCWGKRPTLLVPTTLVQSRSEINWASILCHEMAHYKRRDHISGLLGEMVLCVLPWNLLLWLAKSRLVKLSEQACDDWVVSAGRSGADYARSLLDLVPQGQMALLPTVVAGKKELQTRVRRIVQNHCGEPRAGGRWTVLVTIAAACLALGTALAQEGRADREPPRREAAALEHRQESEVPRERARELGDAERAELIQLRETLLGKISGIERELKELPDNRDVEARELQAKLRDIRAQVRDIDRKLAGRERGDAVIPEQPKLDARASELAQHRRELQQRAQQIERKLAEHPDNPDAPQLQTEMREIQEQIRRINAELGGLPRERREPGRPEADALIRELTEHREQLQNKARDMERRLAERPDSPEAKELRTGLREIQEQIQRINRELAELQRAPRERERPGPEARRAELMRQRDELIEQGHQIKRELNEAGETERAEKLREKGAAIQEKIDAIERELRGLERERPEQARVEELRQAIARLAEQGRGDEAERLERELRQITQRLAERPERRPEAPELEQQVRQLRNEVQGLRQEMAELRELLKQVLQRPAPVPAPDFRQEDAGASRGGGQRPERERSREAERLEPGPRPEQRQAGAETPRF